VRQRRRPPGVDDRRCSGVSGSLSSRRPAQPVRRTEELHEPQGRARFRRGAGSAGFGTVCRGPQGGAGVRTGAAAPVQPQAQQYPQPYRATAVGTPTSAQEARSPVARAGAAAAQPRRGDDAARRSCSAPLAALPCELPRRGPSGCAQTSSSVQDASVSCQQDTKRDPAQLVIPH
jgi:hypothetical protein